MDEQKKKETKEEKSSKKDPQTKKLSSEHIVIMFMTCFSVLAFAIYLKADSSALYTFMGAALGYLFGHYAR